MTSLRLCGVTLKFSVPSLEVALVLSLFFAVPIASVTLDVVSMSLSPGHRHLPFRRMVETVVTAPRGGGDTLKRDQAARVRREVMGAIETAESVATAEFVTSDPHDPMRETSDPHDPAVAP